MEVLPGTESPLRFGSFELDVRSRELRNGTRSVRLQEQPFEILRMMLERPGDVVTRAELQARLWPDTTVDFDAGLNYSVRQLRLALGDDANAPKYVETLPRRGYRFIAPIASDAPVPATRDRRRVLLIAGAFAIVGLLALAFARRTTGKPSPASGVQLAVLPFAVDTTDSLMTTYHRRFMEQLKTSAGAESVLHVAPDTSKATHVLSGVLKRQKFSVIIFVQLVQPPLGRQHRRHLSVRRQLGADGRSHRAQRRQAPLAVARMARR